MPETPEPLAGDLVAASEVLGEVFDARGPRIRKIFARYWLPIETTSTPISFAANGRRWPPARKNGRRGWRRSWPRSAARARLK